MLCHYGKRSLGHEKKAKKDDKGLKGKNLEEKKREKELLQNIFHQLGMLSWDSVPFDGLKKTWQQRLVNTKAKRIPSVSFSFDTAENLEES